MKEEIQNLLIDHSDGKVSFKKLENRIFQLIGKRIDRYEVENYWRSESLDSYVGRLITKPIDHPEQIDDLKAKELIQEILNNLANDPIIERNSDALERRFGKSEGTMSDLIFDKGISDVESILMELKKDTIINL